MSAANTIQMCEKLPSSAFYTSTWGLSTSLHHMCEWREAALGLAAMLGCNQFLTQVRASVRTTAGTDASQNHVLKQKYKC